MSYKKIIVSIAILSLAALLLSACTDKPASESLDSSSTSDISTSTADKAPAALSYSEAADLNKEISPAQVRLIQIGEPADDAKMAVIKTTIGEIKVVLYPDEAPKAVENFITHAEEGYYTGLVFNKVIKNFIIEGGDPDGKGGESIFDSSTDFKNEYSLNLWHFRGALSMSNNYGQDRNGSQFFIVQAPFIDADTKAAMNEINYPEKVTTQYDELGGVPGFDWKRTVFGMVTEDSMKVVDAIARVEVGDGGEPVESVVIEEIRITTYGQEKAESGDEDSES